MGLLGCTAGREDRQAASPKKLNVSVAEFMISPASNSSVPARSSSSSDGSNTNSNQIYRRPLSVGGERRDETGTLLMSTTNNHTSKKKTKKQTKRGPVE